MKGLLVSLTLLMATLPSMLVAQSYKVVEDFRLQSSFEVEKEIWDDFDIFGELGLRLEENVKEIGKMYTEAGISYRPVKYLSLSTKYRFSENRKNYSEAYKYVHLFAFSVEGSYKLDRLKTFCRFLYQTADDETLHDLNSNRNLIKSRLKVKYKIRKTKLTPYILTELYSIVENKSIQGAKLKMIGGVEWKINKVFTTKTYYRIDRELVDYLPYSFYTGGISLKISL